MLTAIARAVNENHQAHTPIAILMNDYALLDKQLSEVKISWHVVADSIGVNRNKLYHWYFETHLRKLGTKITKEEKDLMYQLILAAIRTREIESSTFQLKIKQKIFGKKEIHRAEFSMTFNNLMRTKTIKAELQRHNI